jgi:hypothetical protein
VRFSRVGSRFPRRARRSRGTRTAARRSAAARGVIAGGSVVERVDGPARDEPSRCESPGASGFAMEEPDADREDRVEASVAEIDVLEIPDEELAWPRRTPHSCALPQRSSSKSDRSQYVDRHRVARRRTWRRRRARIRSRASVHRAEGPVTRRSIAAARSPREHAEPLPRETFGGAVSTEALAAARALRRSTSPARERSTALRIDASERSTAQAGSRRPASPAQSKPRRHEPGTNLARTRHRPVTQSPIACCQGHGSAPGGGCRRWALSRVTRPEPGFRPKCEARLHRARCREPPCRLA